MSQPRKRYTLSSGLDPDSDDEPNQPPPLHRPSTIGRPNERTNTQRLWTSQAVDSDDGMDPEITATSNASGKATLTYRAFPAEQKPRLEPIPHAPA